MDDSDKVLELRRSTEARDEDSVLLSYLAQAREIILSRMYPFREESGYSEPEVPRRFEWKQIRIAAYLMNKRGAEGETAHSENGISRSYGAADVPEEMLRDVLPQVGIPR